VVQVAVVVVSQDSLQVELVTPLQLPQHKEPTADQVEQIAPLIASEAEAEARLQPAQQEAQEDRATQLVETVEQEQPHQSQVFQ